MTARTVENRHTIEKGPTMSEPLLRAYVWQQSWRAWLAGRLAAPAGAGGEAGEGVISAAIAVLIMAFLGVTLYVLFKGTLGHANENVNNHIDQLK